MVQERNNVQGTKRERPFLAARGFNINLVQFLLLYHVIISNVQFCSFMCTDEHQKWFSVHEISYTKNYDLWGPDQPDIEKTYIHVREPYKAKYQFLIKSVEMYVKSIIMILKVLLDILMIWRMSVKYWL